MKLILELYNLFEYTVVPAIKTPDGKVYKGEPGDGHVHVLMKYKGKIPYDSIYGFVDNTGKFLTREETKKKYGFSRSEHSPERKGKMSEQEKQIEELLLNENVKEAIMKLNEINEDGEYTPKEGHQVEYQPMHGNQPRGKSKNVRITKVLDNGKYETNIGKTISRKEILGQNLT